MLRRGRAFVFVGAAGLVLAVLGQLEALGPVALDEDETAAPWNFQAASQRAAKLASSATPQL